MANPDIALGLLNTSHLRILFISLSGQGFSKFTLPDPEEGYDDIHYEWTKGNKATEVLQKWIMERKQTSRVEDLNPSQCLAAFKTHL